MNGGQPENQSYKQTFSDFGQHPFNLIAIIDYCKLKYWWGPEIEFSICGATLYSTFALPHYMT